MKPLSQLAAAAVRAAGALLAPGGRRGSLLVLIYHRVLPAPDPLLPGEPDAQAFAAQMDLILSICNVLPLREAAHRLRTGDLPPRAVSITFDDGYANNHSLAAPILRARKLPATVFVASGYIGAGRMWNDTVIESVRVAPARFELRDLGLGDFDLQDDAARVRAIDTILPALKYQEPAERIRKTEAMAARVGLSSAQPTMMSEREIRELSRFGIDVGAHTVMHPILRSVPLDEARREITASKAALEAITGEPVRLFAYPNGRPNRDYDANHVGLVRASGFEGAVSTAWGAVGRDTDPYQMPRMLPWDRTPLGFAARLLRGYGESAETAA